MPGSGSTHRHPVQLPPPERLDVKPLRLGRRGLLQPPPATAAAAVAVAVAVAVRRMSVGVTAGATAVGVRVFGASFEGLVDIPTCRIDPHSKPTYLVLNGIL